MKESELADIVIKQYKKDGYEIYSEVIHKPKSKRADIIATKNGEYIVIETKMGLNLKLIEQAYFWKDKVNKSYICIPSKRKMNRFALMLCRDLGIGVIIYRKKELIYLMESTICDNPDLPKLYEQQKESISGSNQGGYVTPFRLTREKLVKYVTDIEENKCSLLSAIKNIDHHYKSDSSAKNALSKMIDTGVISELNTFKNGRELWIKIK